MRGSRLVPWAVAGFGATLLACAVADNGVGAAGDSGGHPADVGADARVADGPVDSTFDVPPTPDTGVATDTRAESAPDTSTVDTSTPDTTVTAVDSGADSAPTDSGVDLGTPDVPLGCVPVINELQAAGVSAGDEFVEIYNPCGVDLPMAGYKLVYRSHLNVTDSSAAKDSVTVYAFTATDVLPNAGYFVVAGSAFTGPKDATESSTSGDLAAAAGQVGLRDPAGRLLDGVFYGTLPPSGTPAFLEGTPAPSPAAGSSIYRAPDGKDTNDNGVDFSAATPTPTPKAANPAL